MPITNARDKQTIRVAGIAIGIYLALFFAVKGWKTVERHQTEYRQLLSRVQLEEKEIRTYENRILLFEKYRDAFRLDPSLLPVESLVAEASSAIQTAAGDDGIILGPMRESSARNSGREIATIQFDGSGPVAGVLGLIQKLQVIGFPIIIDSLQLTPDAAKPGIVKMDASIIILNFEFWRNGENANG